MRVTEELALVQVFLRLDIAALLVCACVCKPWRSLVRSPWFQSQWLAAQDPLVLVTVSHDGRPPHPVYVSKWSFANPRLSPPLNIHIPGVSNAVEILASSYGLVLACLIDLDNWRYSKLSLAVGNPVTDEWIKLPSPVPAAITLPDKSNYSPLELDYQLRVDATTGHFRVTVTELAERDIRACYDSHLASWSRIPPPATAAEEATVSLFDVDYRKEWVEFQVPELKKPLRIEASTLLSYGGNTYVAGVVRQSLIPKNYGLWKVVGKNRDRLKEVFLQDMYEETDKEVDTYWTGDDVEELLFSCQGDGKLMCMAAYESCRYWPPSVYDLSSGTWFHFDTRPPLAEGGIHFMYTRAVPYRPSLLKPACSSGVTTCPPDRKRYKSSEDVVSCFLKTHPRKRCRNILEDHPEEWEENYGRGRIVTHKKRKCIFCNHGYVVSTMSVPPTS